MVPHGLLIDPNVDPLEKVLCAVLMTYAQRGDRYCYPSLTTLAAVIGRSPKQVARVVANLERRGIITVSKRTGEPNVYDLQPMWVRTPGTSVSLVPITGVSAQVRDRGSDDGDPGHGCPTNKRYSVSLTTSGIEDRELPRTPMSLVPEAPSEEHDALVPAERWAARLAADECSLADVPDEVAVDVANLLAREESTSRLGGLLALRARPAA